MNKIICVIPVYNDEKHIRSAIKSIKEQTYKGQMDIVVWNDGSTDKTHEILKSIEGISIFNNEQNLGLVKTLNKSIEYAYENKYDFYFRQDSDDKSSPSRVKNTLYAMGRTRIDVFSSNRSQSDGTTTSFPNTDKDIKRALLEYNPLTHTSVCFNLKTIAKKDLVYRQDFFPAEDLGLWKELASKGYRFYNSPEFLVEYRLNPSGITTKNKELQEKAVRKIHREIHLDI